MRIFLYLFYLQEHYYVSNNAYERFYDLARLSQLAMILP